MTTGVPSGRPWVFLGHTLEQVGPPVFLLAFLRWLRAETDIAIEVRSLEGGALHDEFSKLGPVQVVAGTTDSAPPSGLTAAPGLVYVNTAVSVRAGLDLLATDAPRVAHVHELEVGLALHTRPEDRAQLFRPGTHWIAASDAVADNLVARHGLARSEIAVHHEMIAIDDRPPTQSAAEIRGQLGIPDGAPLLGTAAVVNWRKGPDLFVQLAWRVAHERPDLDAHLVWVGADPGHMATEQLRSDVAAAGLADRVHVVPFVDRPLDWMRAFDVFVLPAREDAFPLACLEAASVGVPTVCFTSGGMPEFVEDDAGVVVPYGDLAALLAAVTGLLDDPDRCGQLGRRAAAKVRERHDVAQRAPALYADLRRWATP